MEIRPGWGRWEIKFRPMDSKYQATVEMRRIECGGYGAEPTGIVHVMDLDPHQVPGVIESLRTAHAEWEKWTEEYVAGLPPIGEEEK